MKKVLLGMSGGVDSTYAVIELQKAGYEVIGAVLRMSECTDISEAEKAAESVGVPLLVLDCSRRFREIVIADFLSEYARARTPNPCVICNRMVKFEMLCELAEKNGIHHIATGHYAKVFRDEQNGRYYIAQSEDKRKDQSYMLWRLTQKQLSMLIFPLAEKSKSEVKEQAGVLSLACADLPESQEICFIPDHDHVSYIENMLGEFPEGNFVDAQGRALGTHHGIIRYTVGQRKGLGISLGRPAFVSAIDAESNTVTLSIDEKELFQTELTCRSLNFMRLAPGDYEGIPLYAKIRYAASPVPVIVTVQGDVAKVRFLHPVRAVTPGQSIVFYEEDAVAFGGLID